MSYGEENGIKSLKELFWRGNKWRCSQLMGMVVGFSSCGQLMFQINKKRLG